jgi:hypothetical protein
MWRLRTQPVLVAVVYQPGAGFLVVFNEKWKGYAFPMRKPRPTDAGDAFTACQALREAVGRDLPGAVARPLEPLEHRGPSGRTGRMTLYRYQAFEVEPGEPLAPGGGFGDRHGFLDFDRLVATPLVTWSTKVLASELLENQQVALAVVSRPGAGGRTFLMLSSPRYGGYFFPAARLTTDTPPSPAALELVHREIGYPDTLAPGPSLKCEDDHFSPRFGRKRHFVFHVVPVHFPGLDLAAADNDLERGLVKAGAGWRWVSEAELADPAAHNLSPTVAAVRDVVVRSASAGQGP